MARRAGILLHPTSLPGPFGVGDIGPDARRFVDWLALAGQSIWQMLPLGPHSPFGSPYGAWSSFAGNPMLISPELLVTDRLLKDDVVTARVPPGRVDFQAVAAHKETLLRAAWATYVNLPPPALEDRLSRLAEEPGVNGWLEDWVLFAALKQRFGGKAWNRWPEGLRRREPGALSQVRRDLVDELDYHRFVQLVFLDQWFALRERAVQKGIALFGDLAIYVALDSADVWANQELFDLDADGRPRVVAGVPPDYFSATGQLWGNPLYRWERLRERSYDWWIERVAWNLHLNDLVRIDHFRGFASYWEVPANETTAVAGHWRPGPGRAIFDAMRDALGHLPIVAEDLGVITDDVRELRRQLDLPGMRVLQFAFDAVTSEHLPHRLEPNVVVYTGTHDNDTARGWFDAAGSDPRCRALLYLGGTEAEVPWSMIRAALTSVADTAIIPLQDALGLGSEARMNRPGESAGQWAWRLEEMPNEELARRLRQLTVVSGRQAEDNSK